MEETGSSSLCSPGAEQNARYKGRIDKCWMKFLKPIAVDAPQHCSLFSLMAGTKDVQNLLQVLLDVAEPQMYLGYE